MSTYHRMAVRLLIPRTGSLFPSGNIPSIYFWLNVEAIPWSERFYIIAYRELNSYLLLLTNSATIFLLKCSDTVANRVSCITELSCMVNVIWLVQWDCNAMVMKYGLCMLNRGYMEFRVCMAINWLNVVMHTERMKTTKFVKNVGTEMASHIPWV